MILKLFVNYYCDNNTLRADEVNKCFVFNLKNDEINHHYILIKNDDIELFNTLVNLNNINETKYTLIPFEERPTFRQFFELTRLNSTEDELTVISNSDIIIPSEDIKKIKQWDWDGNYCMALCRYDIINENPLEYEFFNRGDSQDVWIVKGGFKDHESSEFTLGILGCDNKIAYYLNEQYILINPSLDIITLHLHISNIRNYDNSNKLNKPYHLIPPEKLTKIN